MTIDITTNTANFFNDTSAITQSGQLATAIFQKVFPLNQKFYNVYVEYDTQVIDQYGNTKNGLYISYDIDQPLYNKINWSGFSTDSK